MTKMKDRYGQDLSIGDRVLVATLAHKSAHLREARVTRIFDVRGTVHAGVRTEAGGSTTVSSRSVARISDGTPELA